MINQPLLSPMRWFQLACMLVLACGCREVKAGLVAIGDVTTGTVGPSYLELKTTSGALVRLDALDPKLIRVRVAQTGTLSTNVSPAILPKGLIGPLINTTELADYWYLGTPELQLFIQKRPFAIVALDHSFSLLSYDASPAVMWDTDSGNIFTQRFALPDEHYFGLGLRGGPIDRRGRNIVMRNTDRFAYTEFTDPLYQSYPFYYALRNGLAHGMFLDNPQYPFFSMNADGRNIVLFGANAHELNYYIIGGPTPYDVANTYSRLTGFNQLPPKWSLGYHHSRYGWSSAAEIEQIATQLRNQDFPTDALWFDIDYMNNRRKFTWASASFPQPTLLHQKLRSLGFKTVYIDEPCLRTDDPLWTYLDARGFLVKNQAAQSLVTNIWFGDVSWFDYTKLEAATWYSDQLKGFLAVGVDGLWNDLNEPASNFLPDAVFDFDGRHLGETESRNLYALLVNKAAYAGQLALRPNVRPWNFSRSGYSGIQRYAHTWSGDGNSDFATLKVNIQMSISMGLSGQNQFGHDTGGFLGSPNAELYIRWLEFSNFTPLFRTHAINTSLPREPWSFGEPYTSTIRDIIKRRYRFLPYIYSLFETASRTGRPVLTPTFFYASGDSATYTQDTDYLFGPNLLIAPVYQPGATTRQVYLPLGSNWISYQTDEAFGGGQTINVSAPLGKTPLFVRAGTVLPLGPATSSVEAPVAANITVEIYPGASGEFVLYEDDGKSFDYQSGVFLYTRIRYAEPTNTQSVTIEHLTGSYLPSARNWTLQLHRQLRSPASITNNGIAIPLASSAANLAALPSGWFFDATRKLLNVKLPDLGNATISVQ